MKQYKHRKAVKAAKVIKKYCETRPDHGCFGCVFCKSGCVLDAGNLPEDWDLSKRRKDEQ